MTTPDPEYQLMDRVLATVARYDLLPRGRRPPDKREPVVVGASGGPDSVALAHVLHRLAAEGKLAVAPVLAHLHHGLRDHTADADRVFVENLACRLDVPLEVAHADVRAEAEARGVGLEEAGRDARRRFFIATARRRGARRVALGHHGGDRIETVLFHILRGTGIDGLATLGPRAPLAPRAGIDLVRPMVHPYIDRNLVLTYLAQTGLSWRKDETNEDPAYMRNRLRHEVLPMLGRRVNPAVREAIFRLADQAEAARAVLDEALERAWREIVREVPGIKGTGIPQTKHDVTPGEAKRLAVDEHPGEIPRRDSSSRHAGTQNDTTGGGPRAILVDADDFEPLAPWTQGAILRRAVERLGGGLKHMSAARTQEAVAALLSGTVAGPVDLPDGLAAERRRRVIRIGPKRGSGPRA